MVLQAGLAALLSRLGAGEDVPIGSPVAGRLDDALDELVGCFMNTLVLRTDVSGDPAFRELLDRARETSLSAYAHQDVPFEQLVEVLDPARSMGRNPLFQVMLVLQNNEHAHLELPGVRAAFEPPAVDSVKFDLNFFVVERQADDGTPGGLDGFLEFSHDVFDESTAASVAERLVRLLEQVADDPDLPVSGIEVLSAPERGRILTEWSGTTGRSTDTTVPALFEAQSARSPGAVAVTFDGTKLSYGELNARANRLARQLIGLGAGPERLVALALPRTEQMVVALLAVLKSGAAYLPVDLAYPAERIALMLDDAGPALLLTDGPTARTLPDTDLPRLLVDDPGTAEARAELPEADVTDRERTSPLGPDHPAFVIYTSGSTGRPKGVTGLHRALVNRLTWFAEEFPEQRTAGVLAKSPVSVIDGITELLAPAAVRRVDGPGRRRHRPQRPPPRGRRRAARHRPADRRPQPPGRLHRQRRTAAHGRLRGLDLQRGAAARRHRGTVPDLPALRPPRELLRSLRGRSGRHPRHPRRRCPRHGHPDRPSDPEHGCVRVGRWVAAGSGGCGG